MAIAQVAVNARDSIGHPSEMADREGRVEEGHYSTEDEVVADALRLMQARDRVAEMRVSGQQIGVPALRRG
jgi:Arc/MetJ-type ribon-helix-helix transcriptional regulator